MKKRLLFLYVLLLLPVVALAQLQPGRPIPSGYPCGGDLGGTMPDCTVTDDSHSHTSATIDLTGISAGGDLSGTYPDPSVKTDLRTRKCFQMEWENIATSDEWVLRLPPFTGTMTRVDCEAYSGTSFTIDICDGEDTGDDTCTTSILGSPLVCGTSGANDTTLNAAGFSARDKVTVVVTAVTGTVKGEVYVTCTVD